MALSVVVAQPDASAQPGADDDAAEGEADQPATGGEAEDGEEVEELGDDPRPEPERPRPPPKPAEPEPLEEEEPEEDAPPDIPAAADLRSGQLSAAVGAHLSLPFGSLEDGRATNDLASSGVGVSADIGYGVHRNVSLGVWGTWLNLAEAEGCSECSVGSLAGGAAVTYYLVQGLRFDPWASAGLGWRMTTAESGGTSVDYGGLVGRFVLGGDWFLTSQLGLGPYLGLDVTRNLTRSDSETPGGALDWQANFGLRIRLDLPGH